MAIAENHYNELKEYWDFQRKREYNYEQLCNVCDNIGSNFRFTNGKNGDELKKDYGTKYNRTSMKSHLKIGFHKMRSIDYGTKEHQRNLRCPLRK